MAKFIGEAVPAYREALVMLANRIAENREKACVHFPSDSMGSRSLVQPIYDLIKDTEPFKTLSSGAAEELGARNGANVDPPFLIHADAFVPDPSRR